MKNAFKILLIFILLMPFKILALFYDDAVNYTNTFIDKYPDNNKFINIDMNKILPYEFKNGRLITNDNFKRGGFLNRDEYLITLTNGSSYLSPGIEYWLLKDNNKGYYVERNINEVHSNDENYGIRITEFVNSDAMVLGKGTFADPWEFTDGYTIKIVSNNSEYGSVDPMYVYSVKPEDKEITINFAIKDGYTFKQTNCLSDEIISKTNIKLNNNRNMFSISNVNSDINCSVTFGPETYVVTLTTEDSTIRGTQHIYETYGQKYSLTNDGKSMSSVDNSITLPFKPGYGFQGYFSSETSDMQYIDANGYITVDANTKTFFNDDGKLYAKWTMCTSGTYSNHETSKCSICPVGYTSDEKAESINDCYIIVGKNKYLETASTTKISKCKFGYFSKEHKVYYGETSDCNTCSFGGKNTLKYKMLTSEIANLDNVASKYVASNDGINFNENSSDINGKGLYVLSSTANNCDAVYYYRGDVNNNNIIYANFCWKIVRTVGSDGIKLLYNGRSVDGKCNSSEDYIDKSIYNTKSDDNTYIGYMYGKTNSKSYNETHANIKNSNIKNVIDKWYRDYLSYYNNEIIDSVWCNDRSFAFENNGTGANNSYTNYASRGRLFVTNKRMPSLTCYNINDTFSVKNNNGNQDLTYPIGLLTSDEIVYAGAIYPEYSKQKGTITSFTPNKSFYLYSKNSYWTMTPESFNSSKIANIVTLGNNGSLIGSNVVNKYAVRPSIVIKSNLKVSKGDGSINNPYIVK